MTTVSVHGCLPGTTTTTLEPLFSNCGPIQSIKMLGDGSSATITYENEDGACVASMLSGCLLSGMTLLVEYDHPDSFNAQRALATSSDIHTADSEPATSESAVYGAVRLGASVVVGGASAVAGGASTVAGGVVNLVKGKEVTGTATSDQYGAGFQPQWGAAPN